MAVNAYNSVDGSDVRYYSPSVTGTTLLSSSSGVGSSLTSTSANLLNHLGSGLYRSEETVPESGSYKPGYKFKPKQSNVLDYQFVTPLANVEHSNLPNQSSVPITDDMNMRFTDLTHMHLKRSVEQHNSYLTDPSNRYFKSTSTSLCNPTSVYSGSYSMSNGSTSPRIDSSRSSHIDGEYLENATKYQNIISVKNAILEEKESQILKLRAQLNAQSHLSSSSSSRSLPDGLVRNLKGVNINQSKSDNAIDTEYQAASCRVKLAENFAEQEKNVNDLQNLLGKTEFQLAETKTLHARDKNSYEEKIKELEFCLRAKDKSIEKLTKKQKEMIERNEKYKRRVESLERYLSDLPTIEETTELKRSLNTLKNVKETLTSELENYKETLYLSKQEIHSKEERIHKEAINNIELGNKIKELNEEIILYQNNEQEMAETERKQFQNAMLELETLRKEREEAAKLLSAADVKIKNLNSEFRSEIVALKDKLEGEESVSKALRDELNAKQITSFKLQTTLSQLGSQNQQLMEEKLSLMEQVRKRDGERNVTRNVGRMNVRLHRELQAAVQEVQNVTNLLIQSAKGDDPNLSELLGVRPSSFGVTEDDGDGSSKATTGTSDSSDADSDMSMEGIKQRLSQIRRLRKDIDELRSNISNKYAENIGENCATQ